MGRRQTGMNTSQHSCRTICETRPRTFEAIVTQAQIHTYVHTYTHMYAYTHSNYTSFSMGFSVTSHDTEAVWIRTQVATNCMWASIRFAYSVKNCSGKVDDKEEAYKSMIYKAATIQPLICMHLHQ